MRAGWRAAHAYPRELYIATRFAAAESQPTSLEIASGLEDYGVPITLVRGRTAPEVIASLEEAAA